MFKTYRLINEDGLCYYGRTSGKYLSSRLSIHKSQALTKREIYKCTSSILFENNKSVKIELIEQYDDKEKSKQGELQLILNNVCVNKMKSGLDYKQSKKNWNEKNKGYANEYYHRTKEKRLESSKKYQATEKGKINRRKSTLNFYERNKERLNEIINCQCGSNVKFINMNKHKKTQKHRKR